MRVVIAEDSVLLRKGLERLPSDGRTSPYRPLTPFASSQIPKPKPKTT
jgi:hypothetical protein